MYVNNTWDGILNFIQMLADDTKLHANCKKKKEDGKYLQKDIVRLEDWAKKWQIKFMQPSVRWGT